MAIKEWHIKSAEPAAAARIAAETGCGRLLARVLAARGLTDPELVEEYLSKGAQSEDPTALKDVEKAAERINIAVESGETVAVFGDYDVDGITSSAVMSGYLEAMGASVLVRLPRREGEGYGLCREAIDELARQGATLIITVDNGITALEEAKYIRSLGIDLIVCDHHLPGSELPDALAVVDPQRRDDRSAFKELSGVGVAVKLIAAAEGCGAEDIMEHYGALCAVGTIADIMPLVGENRSAVAAGIEQLRVTDNLGLIALCGRAGIELSSIDARGVAFGIAPRLNAAGRIGDAMDAFRLLTTEDPEEAEALAEKLDMQNTERQQIEKEITDRIDARIAAEPELARRPVIVIEDEGLHAGVIGIACSRLVDRYGRPSIIITSQNGEGKGSGRSIKGFSLYDALAACRDTLTKFGGHELAAGLTLPSDNVEAFRQKLWDYCASRDMPVPQLDIDCEVRADELSVETVGELAALEPLGAANEAPLFLVRGATVAELTPLSEGRHTRVTLESGGRRLALAMFGTPPCAVPYDRGDKVDAAFAAGTREYGGKTYLSLRGVDMRPAGADGIASLLLYRSFAAQPKPSPVFKPVAPDRAEVGTVYRALKEREYPADDPFALAERCALPEGKVVASCDVLAQLGLAAITCFDRCRTIRAVESDKKKDLFDSAIFTALSGC